MSKTKIPFLISIVVIAVLVVASFIEPAAGAATARRMVYGTWWFRILWGALAVSGAWMCIHWRLWKKPAAALLHVSFLVILAGALTTALTSTEGSLMLYEGEQTDMFLTRDQHVAHLDFTLRLDSFRIDRYSDTGEPSGYRSHVTIIDPNSSTPGSSLASHEKATISMNHILRYRRLRFYQTSHTPDGLGTVLSVVHDPYGIGITYAGYALLLLSAIGLLLPRRLRRPSTAALSIAAITTVATLGYTLRWTSADHLLPVLRSPLLGVHIGVIIVAYSLFLIMALLSAYNLLRPKRSNPAAQSPKEQASLSEHSPLASKLLLPAVLFLAVGIFLGAVWANISWGTYWTWDPKEVWALITLLIYCQPLHRRSMPWFRNERHLHFYLVFAFFSVLITYFGVNLVLGGMHSYAG